MNIDTEVFFDDKATTADGSNLKKKSGTSMQASQKQRLCFYQALADFHLFHF